jgi:hypothetical protein
VRPELKAWIAQMAKEQERSQGWITNRLLEEAFARATAQKKELQQ